LIDSILRDPAVRLPFFLPRKIVRRKPPELSPPRLLPEPGFFILRRSALGPRVSCYAGAMRQVVAIHGGDTYASEELYVAALRGTQ
jgi:hypothetical protein